MGFFKRLFGSYSDKELRRIEPIAQKVMDSEPTYEKMTDKELQNQTQILRDRLSAGETVDDILVDAFAVCREAAWRVLGMKPFYVQIVGGIVLHQGRIAEMKTGEGKTLVAVLPAYLNALEGKGVHIVTVNDYLAKRDSDWMGKVYHFLGLEVGVIVHGISKDERRAAYNADITYGTNNEMGFDYLRDNMVVYKQDKVQRGFSYAIVDEVDSILIDEARTPLIISGRGDKSTELYGQANSFARTLKAEYITETDRKIDQDDASDADYIVDEKAKTATLTRTGVAKAERHFNIENLMDGDSITLQHHINQAIKALGVMRRDVDYVVRDGEVIIVDESTGRLMMGRRYNEGLHQAIEAKEGVTVERESKTLATITFQNYFRMYNKLSGMTGTALTEEDEFREIYNLDVIEIPTNQPVVREDNPDIVYKTQPAKFRAVIEEILQAHAKGQPVLVGTVSIEMSEHLSKLLKSRGIKHEVLNAKYHEKEAEIVAQAGKLGQVTIATNMAGRGTDIVLGGNADYMAKEQLYKEGFTEELIAEADGHSVTDDEEVIEVRNRYSQLVKEHKLETDKEAEEVRKSGGLYIIGTERHESRRIDNQLRGRAGRQGDPGASRFYLSLEDDLMRLFGGERIQTLMDTMNIDEDMPIESGILTNSIEGAQKRVESRNFGIRKSVLDFDDVMNRQREIIYGQRNQVLDGDDMSQYLKGMVEQLIDEHVDLYLSSDLSPEDWNITPLKEYFYGWILFDNDLDYSKEELRKIKPQQVKDEINQKAKEVYQRREDNFSSSVMRDVERFILLKNVDNKWMSHIDAMDQLKQGIYLRSYGQRDPVVEYRIEGFEMFDEMVTEIREDTVKMLYVFQLKNEDDAPKREQVLAPTEATHGSDGSIEQKPVVRKGRKIGRNEPCPCGSDKKYKHCCGR